MRYLDDEEAFEEMNEAKRSSIEEILKEETSESTEDCLQDMIYKDYLFEQEMKECDKRREEILCHAIEHEYDDFEQAHFEDKYTDEGYIFFTRSLI
jgi:hypothetical protein